MWRWSSVVSTFPTADFIHVHQCKKLVDSQSKVRRLETTKYIVCLCRLSTVAMLIHLPLPSFLHSLLLCRHQCASMKWNDTWNIQLQATPLAYMIWMVYSYTLQILPIPSPPSFAYITTQIRLKSSDQLIYYIHLILHFWYHELGSLSLSISLQRVFPPSCML